MNPFSSFGTIVYEEQFIGREAALGVITNRVTGVSEPSCLSIVGAPRIGKSSLAWQGVMCSRKELIARQTIPLWIECGHLEGRDLFQKMVTDALEALVELDVKDGELAKRSRSVVASFQAPWVEMTRTVMRFFKRVRELGWRLVYVLDEFDNARKMFSQDGAAFHFLRELAYNPDRRITYVTTSRRTIADIQGTCPISNLPGIFRQLNLGVFGQPERQVIFKKIQEASGVKEDIANELADYFAGGQPYLLGMLGAMITELADEGEPVTESTLRSRIQPDLLEFYDSQLIPILREETRLTNLLSVLFGGSLDVREDSKDFLEQYGVIASDEDGEFRGFSRHFEDYLRVVELEDDAWPVWKRAETALRRVIEATFQEKVGEDWLNELAKSKPHLSSMLEQCRAAMAKEQKTFGGRASRRLLDFAYPGGLFDVVFAEWGLFKEILGRDKSYWSQRRDLLVRVRNPMAHNRDDVLLEHERVIFKGFCEEIITTCEEGESTCRKWQHRT